MNQGKIWTVVHPTVGLPLLLGSVAITALIVHAEVLAHTTWFSGYWQGASKQKVSMDTVTPQGDSKAAFSMTVTPVPATAAAPASFVITVAPNTSSAVVQAADDTTSNKPIALPIRSASKD